MTTRARTALTAGVLALALVVMGMGFPAKTVPPKEWTGGLCTALDTWRGVAVDGADQLKMSLSAQQQVSLADTRTALADYLGDVSDATATATRQIEDLGAPDTPHGRRIERRLVKLFRGIERSVANLQDRAEHMSTTKQRVALRQVRSIQADVNGMFDGFTKDFSKLKRLDTGRRIDKAFAASAACRAASS
jgi:hypothetical protein